MSRNVTLQVLRGSKQNMPALADAEFYFAEDTAELYVGFSGGTLRIHMPVQIQDSAGNNLTSTGGALDVNVKSNTDSPIPVSAATLPLPAGASTDANLTSGNVKFQLVDNAGHSANIDPSGTVRVNLVTPSTLPTTQVGGASGLPGDTQVKGVQGTVALMVQDFKDAGRVLKVFAAQFTAATTEALVSLTPTSDGVAGSAATSFAVTAGKKLRIQALLLTCFNATAAIHSCQVNLRISPTGAATVTSPIFGTVATSTAAATANLSNSQAQSFPDGIELSGPMQFAVSQVGVALAGQTVVVIGYEY